jgi:Response regulators consisting of a CheY-like receiver domain and a winged-helix DNA-binding domain
MEPLKILFVDDDLDFGKLICLGLNQLAYKVHFQTSLAGIEEAITQFSPSIIVLDVEIGEENGIEKARELISVFPSLPILFVSSHTDISFVTEGIAAGGVHYLKKPFDIRELDAYIQRFASKQPISKEICIGNYLLNAETSQLFYDDTLPIQITPLEKNALVLFWKNKNTPVSSDLLSRDVWGKKHTPDLDPSIHNLISKLRKLLNKDEHVWISTVKGVGYQLTIL